MAVHTRSTRTDTDSLVLRHTGGVQDVGEGFFGEVKDADGGAKDSLCQPKTHRQKISYDLYLFDICA